MKNEIIYSKLRLDVLIDMSILRGIECSLKKNEIIKYLEMDDLGKYVRSTTYEKQGKKFLIGIDPRNQSQLIEIGKMLERHEIKNLNTFYDNRLHFLSDVEIKFEV